MSSNRRLAIFAVALLALAATPDPADAQLPIRNWGYQLQGFDLAALRDSMFDVLVIDYSTTGGAGGELTAAQVRDLRENGPCGERIVLAYFSVGEAENYRYYFDADWLGPNDQLTPGAPAWLGPANPDWEGNYKVRYWHRAWQRQLWGTRGGDAKSYLDRIIDAGFDGVYLDIVDAFEYWGPRENGGTDENRKAAPAMIKFVQRLAKYARRKRSAAGFFVVPQNGAGLIAEWSYPDSPQPEKAAMKQRRRYFKVISAIGTEDTFFVGNRNEDNPYRPQEGLLPLLQQFVAAGKSVLAVEYLTKAPAIDRFWDEAVTAGFVPYVARRDLDRLTIPAGHPPECRVDGGMP
jgi:cysteinyl-tRNA synthetase